MSRLHQPSGLNTHFPMQHHSLTVNTAWKTANAIFSNGCYEEGEIVASRKTGSGVDRQYSPVTGSAPCQDAAAVCCWNRGKKTKKKTPENAVFLPKRKTLLYNHFLSQLQYCRDIHYTQMSDILIMLRGLQFHHNLMWEI